MRSNLFTLSALVLSAVAAVGHAQAATWEVVLPPQSQWTLADKLSVIAFSNECNSTFEGSRYGYVTTRVLPDGRLRVVCHLPPPPVRFTCSRVGHTAECQQQP